MKSKKTIFILEDDESFAIIAKRWLEDAGYEVKTATNIEEAKRRLDEITKPDLFWIDFYLGANQENGLDFYRWIQENPKLKSIPTIMVSITVNAEKLKEFEKHGIAKTFSKTMTNREDILDGIKKILGD